MLEALDTSVRGRHDIMNLLATPPLAVLPWIETSADRSKRVRRTRYAWAGAAASVLLTRGRDPLPHPAAQHRLGGSSATTGRAVKNFTRLLDLDRAQRDGAGGSPCRDA